MQWNCAHVKNVTCVPKNMLHKNIKRESYTWLFYFFFYLFTILLSWEISQLCGVKHIVVIFCIVEMKIYCQRYFGITMLTISPFSYLLPLTKNAFHNSLSTLKGMTWMFVWSTGIAMDMCFQAWKYKLKQSTYLPI